MFNRGTIVLVLTFIGASFFWAIKGFKGKFDDEISGITEYSDKSGRNAITGIVIIFLIVFIISRIVS